MKRMSFAIVVALVMVFASLTVGNAAVLDKETILVGTESTYPPYEFRGSDNSLQGFDIELTEALAEIMGKKVEWVDMPFDSLIPALLSGKIDLIAAGLSATEERARKVAFSEAYEISLSTFIVKAGREDIKSMEDLKGKVVAAQLGTVQDSFATAIEGVGEVKRFQKFDDCVREVALERADATLMDRPVAVKFVAQKDFADKVSLAFDQEITGAAKALATRLDEETFLKALDDALATLKADGRLEALKNKWMKY